MDSRRAHGKILGDERQSVGCRKEGGLSAYQSSVRAEVVNK
jgi:hypothetical protein